MKNKLNIQWFIEQHSDWEKLLSEKPYCLHITKDNFNGKNLVMFKYDQIESDMSLPIVQECRGLILDFDTNEIVSFPFKKFFNAGETNAAEIDWKSCYVTEKLDGSLIKLTRIGDNILWSTNGTIDAFKAPLVEQIGCIAKSFGELAWYAILENYCKARDLSVSDCIDPDIVKDWLKSIIKPGYTYMFELTSPYNKVVVTWHKTELHFIGCRDNTTGQEIFFGDHELSKIFDTPKVFPLRSVDECVKAASELDVNAEGYVVVDNKFNRVKIKSPTYVSLHHMRNNGVLSYERGLEIVRGNEIGEVLTYFPEFKEHLDAIKVKYDEYVASLEESASKLNEWIRANGYNAQHWWIEAGGQKRKDVAIFITKNFKVPGVGFALLDNKVKSVKEWALNVPGKNLVKALGFKE